MPMITIKAKLEKLGAAAEKTGWTVLIIPAAAARKLKPGTKKSFRVKGTIDSYPIKFVALLPRGNGDFFFATNAAMRKAIKKPIGETVTLQLETDDAEFKIDKDLAACLKDAPAASTYFYSLPASHQHWFSNWVAGAKTVGTKTKRLSVIMDACEKKMGFGEMMRNYRDEKSLRE